MAEYHMSQRARSCLIVGLVDTTEPRHVMAAAAAARRKKVIKEKAELTQLY